MVSFAAGPSPHGITFGAGSVWVSNDTSTGTVTRLDQSSGAVQATIGVGANPHAVRFVDGKTHVAGYGSGRLYIIDAASNTTTTQQKASGLNVLAWDGTALWLGWYGVGQFGAVVGGSSTVWSPAASDLTDIWVAGSGDNTVYRLRV